MDSRSLQPTRLHDSCSYLLRLPPTNPGMFILILLHFLYSIREVRHRDEALHSSIHCSQQTLLLPRKISSLHRKQVSNLAMVRFPSTNSPL